MGSLRGENCGFAMNLFGFCSSLGELVDRDGGHWGGFSEVVAGMSDNKGVVGSKTTPVQALIGVYI